MSLDSVTWYYQITYYIQVVFRTCEPGFILDTDKRVILKHTESEFSGIKLCSNPKI